MQTKTMTQVVGAFGAAALIAIGMAAAVPHLGAAQDPNQGPPVGRMGGRGPGGPGGMGRGGRGGPGGPGAPMAFGLDPRDLTDAQREQIKAIRQRHMAEIKPLADAAAKAHQDLNAAVLSGGDLQGPSQAIGAAETALAFATAQVETEVLGVLTPEQKQKIQDRQKQMDARRAEMEQRRQSRGAGNGM
jgi:Spy/CpxP family protein refolding chaperone